MGKKPERWVRGKEDFASFPVLAALAQRPLSVKELAHILLTSESKVRERLVSLEDRGWVVQRVKDKRWLMIVRLVATGVPTPPGDSWTNPHVETPIEAGPPTGRIVLEAVGGPQGEGVGSEAVGAPPEGPQRQPGPRRSDPEKIAAHFGVPVRQRGADVEIGALAPCRWCGGRTPMRYGDRPTCPTCAKVAPEDDEGIRQEEP